MVREVGGRMMRRGLQTALVIAGFVVVGVAMIVAILALVPSESSSDNNAPTAKERFCGYATVATGARLVFLATNQPVLDIADIADTYTHTAPPDLRPQARRLRDGILAMNGQRPPRAPSPQVVDTARRIDEGITAYCKGVAR